MQVLFAITKGEIGGAQEHLLMEATGLTHRGHHVAALVTQHSQLAERLARLGAEVLPWHSVVRDVHPLKDLRARTQLRATVRAVRPDILHLHSAKAGVLGRALLRPPAGVTVYTCHHAPFGPGRKWSHRMVARPIEQLTLRYVDGIISDGARDMPALRRLAPKVSIRLVRNAVIHRTEPLSPSTPGNVALWVARMRHPKDPLQAISAWEHVWERHPDGTFLIAGDGPMEEALRRRIARSPARSSIVYDGKVPDLDDWFARASVFVLATGVEGGNTMATLEAMGHGVVPVLSDAGDAFLVDHARAGIVVPRNSARTLGDAINWLFDHPDEVRAMRERAIRFAREDWTADDHVDAVVDFYEEVLRNARTTARQESPTEGTSRTP